MRCEECIFYDDGVMGKLIFHEGECSQLGIEVSKDEECECIGGHSNGLRKL